MLVLNLQRAGNSPTVIRAGDGQYAMYLVQVHRTGLSQPAEIGVWIVDRARRVKVVVSAFSPDRGHRYPFLHPRVVNAAHSAAAPGSSRPAVAPPTLGGAQSKVKRAPGS
jgi:hypothetical protein